MFSWRILWLLNLPTGLILFALGGLIPESAKFLLARGRNAEAQAVMARFGTVRLEWSWGKRLTPSCATVISTDLGIKLWTPALIGKTAALTIAALSWGLINFGLLLWMPNDLVAKGYSMARFEQTAGRVGADRVSDGFHLHVSLQPLEHEMGAGHRDRDHPARADLGALARDNSGRQPGFADRAADRRE